MRRRHCRSRVDDDDDGQVWYGISFMICIHSHFIMIMIKRYFICINIDCHGHESMCLSFSIDSGSLWFTILIWSPISIQNHTSIKWGDRQTVHNILVLEKCIYTWLKSLWIGLEWKHERHYEPCWPVNNIHLHSSIRRTIHLLHTSLASVSSCGRPS